MKKENKKGFVLLYAVLVTTVVLAVGLVMSNIITKQITLSFIGRDSQVAFYAADAGIECFKFWANQRIFSVDGVKFSCFGGTEFQVGGAPGTQDFSVFFGGNGSCAKVTIERNNAGDILNSSSLGYNIGSQSECPIFSNRLVYRFRGSI